MDKHKGLLQQIQESELVYSDMAPLTMKGLEEIIKQLEAKYAKPTKYQISLLTFELIPDEHLEDAVKEWSKYYTFASGAKAYKAFIERWERVTGKKWTGEL